MSLSFRAISRSGIAAAALLTAVPAFAGPPLLCHPYKIGTAQSLPWSGVQGWSDVDPSYKIDNLVADTEALLTPTTPVIARMETLRRASIYASKDPAVASALLNRLMARADAASKGGQGDALAWLDAAYVAGAFREIVMLAKSGEFAQRAPGVQKALGNVDSKALIAKSIAARPDDATIRFAAAVISADSDRKAYEEHAAKARAGAATDALLAKNLDHVS